MTAHAKRRGSLLLPEGWQAEPALPDGCAAQEKGSGRSLPQVALAAGVPSFCQMMGVTQHARKVCSAFQLW